MRAILLFTALALTPSVFGVAIGENLIRNDFAGDGVGGILNWSVCRSLGGVKEERLREKGPDGYPVLRLSGGIGKFSYDHSMSRFVSNERFRLSVNVRAHGLDPNVRNEFLVYSGGWRWDGAAKIPADTDGKWVEVSWEGPLKESPGDVYNCAFYFAGIPAGGYVDISNPRMVALTEKGAAGSLPKPDTKPFTPRITPVEPLLCEVDADIAWIDFYFPGDLEGDPADYEIVAQAAGKETRATLCENSHAKVVFGCLPEGWHKVDVELRRKGGGKALFRNEYEMKVGRPIAATRGNRLNNFVTELRRERLADGDYEFTLARDGWVYVGLGGSFPGVTADIDGPALPSAVKHRQGEPSETMRRLKAGRHVVTVKGVGTGADGMLSIRSVKVLSLGFGRTAFRGTDIGRYGAYGPEFYRRFGVYMVVNTASLPDWIEKTRPDFIADLVARGCENLAHLGLGSRARLRNDLEKFRGVFTGHPAWKRGEAIIVDENAIGADSLMKYNSAEVLWDVGRNHRIDICLEDAVRCTFGSPAREIPELSAMVNAGNGTSHMLPETYIPAMEDEADVETVKAYWKDLSNRARALVPGAPGRIVYLMGGWVWPGVFNPWYSPECDIKAYYDEFFHMLATDPAFADIGGLGFSTPACDEGVYRFTLYAMRHYCVEGSRERLSPRFGLKYHADIMDNGDFTEGFAGWTPQPAEEGAIAIGHRKSFGKGTAAQLRQYNAYKPPRKPYGDDFAMFKRTAAGVNRLARKLVNLVPGKVYELMFCSYDGDDIERPGTITSPIDMVRVRIEGGDEIPELRYTCLTDRNKGVKKGKTDTVTHRVVFRAKSATATAVFSDDGAEAKPGMRRAINWVGARPYFVVDEDELKAITEIGASRFKKKSVGS